MYAKIGDNAKVGDVVVLANVDFTHSGAPWEGVSLPAILVVTGKVMDTGPASKLLYPGAVYTLRNAVTGQEELSYSDSDRKHTINGYLISVADFLDSQNRQVADLTKRLERAADDFRLLRGIMERQGARIVTEQQARELGILEKKP